MPKTGDERSQLDAWLEFHRLTLLGKCAGLAAGQLAERSAEPSTLSLIGLVRHMAEVERGWFCGRYFGAELGNLYCSDSSPDGDFDEADAARAEQDLAIYKEEVAKAREATAGHSLDETFRLPDQDVSLRWIYLHMIEEYARHNGHADLLRQRIDGAVGV